MPQKGFICLKKNKEILIATSNKGKVNEFINLFEDYDVFNLTDLGLGDAVEDGTSFLENALIKAKFGSLHSGKYTIADDSGLVIPKLDYEPGIFSARYAGSDASDKDNRNKVIQKLNSLSLENLDAYYVCCLVGIRNHDDPMPIISYGKINGKVSVYSSGEGGFGYDKIFYPSGFDCSMASIDIKVKNTISHRALAVKDFVNKFKAASS